MNGKTSITLSQKEIGLVVKILPKTVRREDPIELNYIFLKSLSSLKFQKVGSLVGATAF